MSDDPIMKKRLEDRARTLSWLATQTSHAKCCFAARNALRAVAGIGRERDRRYRQVALHALRATLVATVAAKMPDVDLSSEAKDASAAASRAAYLEDQRCFHVTSVILEVSSCAFAAADIAGCMGQPHDHVDDMAKDTAFTTALMSHTLFRGPRYHPSWDSETGIVRAIARWSELYEMSHRDADGIDAASCPSDIFDHPLWPNGTVPQSFGRPLRSLKELWKEEPDVWRFWDNWYDSMQTGKNIDWKTSLFVAQLPDEDWEMGAETIAKRLRGIIG